MTISPSETALACDGDQLELTRSLTGRVLEWNISLMPEDHSLEQVTEGQVETDETETEIGNGKAEIRKWSSQMFEELPFAHVQTVCN